MRNLRIGLFLGALAAGMLLVPCPALSGDSPRPEDNATGPIAAAKEDTAASEAEPADDAAPEKDETTAADDDADHDGEEAAATSDSGEASPSGDSPGQRAWLTRLNPFRPIPRPTPPEPEPPAEEPARTETVLPDTATSTGLDPEPPEPVVLRLSGILVSGRDPGTRMALVNDAIVQVGDLVGGYVITEIEPAYVAARKDGADYVMTPLRPMAQAAERIEPTADAAPADPSPSELSAAPPQDAVPVPTEPGPKPEAEAAEARRHWTPGFFFEEGPAEAPEEPAPARAEDSPEKEEERETTVYAPIPPPEDNPAEESAAKGAADAKADSRTPPRAAARSIKDNSASDRRPDAKKERRPWLHLPDPFADVVLPTPIGLTLPGRGED